MPRMERWSTILLLVFAVAAGEVAAQAAPPRSDGAMLLLTGAAEIDVANDEAVVHFYLEQQDVDLQRAQSLVNQRVSEAVAQLKRADPSASVETAGYSSYPVYQPGTQQKLAGWRIRQSVSLRTTDLAALPRAVAAAQQWLALGGIDFRLSRAAREKVESELIERAIANLNTRIAAAARALNVPADKVRLEELNFGVMPPPVMPLATQARAQMMASTPAVAEPHFDAGRSLQQLTVTAKARLPAP
jgi:predicted secreted protein